MISIQKPQSSTPFESEIDLLFNPKKIRELIGIEKQNRGVAENKLVFVGIANLSKYYWCAIHSVLESRESELMFFSAYLQDRLKYSLKLGLIKHLPKDLGDLLRVGDEITLRDVETLLLKEKSRTNLGTTRMEGEEFTDKNGRRAMILNPDLRSEERLKYEEWAKRNDVRIANLDENPIARGNMMHVNKAESYPSIRWNFKMDNYVAVGAPDGITDDFVYEYKTATNKYLAMFAKPCAFAQADLYGHLFERKKKRVQIYTTADGKTQTWEVPTSGEKVTELLANFAKVDEGKLFPQSPKKWKCEHCAICQFGKLCQTGTNNS